MNRAEERRRASELQAVDVRGLINASFPFVLSRLTAGEIDMLQRILDVAVINADIEGKADVIDRQSIRGRIIHSDRYLRDPAIVARRDKVLTQVIKSKLENTIRLDLKKLLKSDALRPRSDNPDEAAYLLVVAEAFENHGVWLVLDTPAAYVTLQKAVTDPQKWRLRLMLGYKTGWTGGEITTRDGSLAREALLSVSQLSAGYYDWVHKGPTMKALEETLKRVKYQMEKGWNEHTWWFSHRAEFPIVSKVSDLFGGADWPDTGIWRQPHDMYQMAQGLISEGKVSEAAKIALLATYQTEWCARAVHEYAKATTKGASRVVEILEVVKVCGEIAGWILSILAVGHGLIRLLSQKGGQAALQGGAQRQLPGGQRSLPPPAVPVPARVPTTPNGTMRGSGVGPANAPAGVPSPGPGPVQYERGTLVSDHGRDLGNAIDYARQKLGMPPRMARTLNGDLALAENARFKKAHAEFMDWLLRNPTASFAQKEAQREKVLAHWVWDH